MCVRTWLLCFSHKEGVCACFQMPGGQLWGLEQLLTAQHPSHPETGSVGAGDSDAGLLEDRPEGALGTDWLASVSSGHL